MPNNSNLSTYHFRTDPCNEQQLSLDLYPRCTIGRRGIPIFYKAGHYCLHKVSHCSVQIHFHFHKNILLYLDHFNVIIHMMKIVIKYLISTSIRLYCMYCYRTCFNFDPKPRVSFMSVGVKFNYHLCWIGDDFRRIIFTTKCPLYWSIILSFIHFHPIIPEVKWINSIE